MKTVVYRLLLLVILVIIQFAFLSRGNIDFITSKESDTNSSIVALNTQDTNNTISIVETNSTQVIEVSITDINDTNTQADVNMSAPIIQVVKDTAIALDTNITQVVNNDINMQSTSTNKVEDISTTIVKEDNQTQGIVDAQPKKKGFGKVITTGYSLIRHTPVLDKTKANVAYGKNKGTTMNYKEELDDWYLLYDDKYIHKSIVKRVD